MVRHQTRYLLIIAGTLLAVSWGITQLPVPPKPPAVDHPSHPEPQPPDLLELNVIEEDAASGRLTAEIVVKPGLNGAAELVILSPAGLSLADGRSRRPLQLRRGDAFTRERVELRAPPGRSAALRVELRLLDEHGQPKLVLTRERLLNSPPAPAAPARVPVVHTLPDGSRIVEYVPTNAPSAPRAR